MPRSAYLDIAVDIKPRVSCAVECHGAAGGVYDDLAFFSYVSWMQNDVAADVVTCDLHAKPEVKQRGLRCMGMSLSP